ncbi:hypothetical protein [Halanaerobium hydrogeniformans]|uniref:Transglutaminase domain-containing protein n=1 Tax=Halanaerobium hydrogeniformans TaxID=656519 RepID=E4RMT8_HALHG|nr:hypothetical protein [Halanaerobium hydrogeniformans]ADQ14155.1 hypothetical protein Halsa_0704 [Halanaerobium hydrogeniformans]
MKEKHLFQKYILVFSLTILIAFMFFGQVSASQNEIEIPRSFRIQLTMGINRVPNLNTVQRNNLINEIIHMIEEKNITIEFVENYFDSHDMQNKNAEKIIQDFNQEIINNYDEADFNTRQLRVKANYRVDLTNYHPETGQMHWVPSNRLGYPIKTLDELKALKGKPEELRNEITTLYEALAYIQISDMQLSSGNKTTMEEYRNYLISWQFPAPAEYTIEKNHANCAGMANLITYLLEDNYDEVGTIWYSNSYILGDRRGGHLINYIKHNNKYYVFDGLPYIMEQEVYSSPENGQTYYEGNSLGVIHEINIDEYGNPDFNPFIDMLTYFNPNIAHMSLISETRLPAIGTKTNVANKYRENYLANTIRNNQFEQIYQNPKDPREITIHEFNSDIPIEYRDYPPY